jgi:hypothetical protein
MPSLSVPQLTVTLSGTNVTITVSYAGTWSFFERFLGENGLVFREDIEIIGEDAGSGDDVVLHKFSMTLGPSSSLSFTRNPSFTVSRQSLQEDIGSDNDEITCRVTVTPIGMPARRVVQSAQTTLAG